MQQMQEVPADGIVIGLGLNAPAVMRIVVPVKQNGAERGHQAVGNILGTGNVVILFLRQHGAEHGDTGAHHIHRMSRCGNPFERGFQVRGQTTQTLELGLVRLEFSDGRQLAMHEQICDLFELGGAGNIEDVIATIMQIIARLADGAQRGIARCHTRQRD